MTNIKYFNHLHIPKNAIFRILDTPVDIYTTDISEVIDICRSYGKDYDMNFIQIDIINLDSDGVIPKDITSKKLSGLELREELVKYPRVRRIILSGNGKEVYLEKFILYTDLSNDFYHEYFFDYNLLYGKSNKALDAAMRGENIYSTITKNDYSPKDDSSLREKELKITFNPLCEKTVTMYHYGITRPYIEISDVMYMLEAYVVEHKRYGWAEDTDIWFVPASTLRVKK